MRRLIFALILLIYTLGAYPCLAQTNVIWKWVDGAGKEHFTGNFNSIPESYRNSAVQGQFMPDKPLRDNNKPPKNLNPKLKVTNKLEVFEEKYFENDEMLVVQGKVRNGFAQSISNIKIKVTFLDKDDSFIKAETSFIDPIVLQPGQEGQFKIQTPFTPEISSYKREIIIK